jgi:hypothetical protein
MTFSALIPEHRKSFPVSNRPPRPRIRQADMRTHIAAHTCRKRHRPIPPPNSPLPPTTLCTAFGDGYTKHGKTGSSAQLAEERGRPGTRGTKLTGVVPHGRSPGKGTRGERGREQDRRSHHATVQRPCMSIPHNPWYTSATSVRRRAADEEPGGGDGNDAMHP